MVSRSVDVGMPVHGPPRFLAQAVESVLGQTHRDLRLFAFDDTGADEPEAALAPVLGDRRLDYRRIEPTSATGAMTQLIAAGDGPYFAFLHDDDRWQPGFLERRVEFLERHPECSFVFSSHADIDDRGAIVARAPAAFPEGVISQGELVAALQQRPAVDVMHSVLCRREALERAGPRLDESIPRLFDWELWLRLALTGPAGYLDVADAEYRAHGDQMSTEPGRGGGVAEFFEHADRLVAERAPELALEPRPRSRRDARVLLSVALDRLQEDDPRGALRALRGALGTSAGTTLADRRVAAVVAGVALGQRGRRFIGHLRAAHYRRGQRRRLRASARER